ncbi:MAG: HAMP domain-containing sensor histidine kinase [Candidatus Dormiibacterota bacterium]
MPLRARLALFGAAVVALTLVLFGVLLYALLAHGVITNQDDALRSRAQDAVRALDAGSDLAPRAPIAPADLKTSTDVFVEVLDQGWSPVYATAVLNGAPLDIAPRLRANVGATAGGVFDTEGGLRLYAVRYRSGFVVAGQSTRVPQSSLSGIVVFLVVSAIPALLAALLASWLVAGRALKPLKVVAGTAYEIGRTRDFGRRLPTPASADEVALLSTSFNTMLEQLQDSFDAQRRFVADASHELRTPLTTIQGNAGLLARGPEIGDDVRRAAAADIADESARMARLVDRMLTLARADAGLVLALAPIDVNEVVIEVCRQAAAVHVDRELTVDCAEAVVDGDADALRQLTWILLDNAFRHGRSKVLVTLSVEGPWARLVVADDGAGIADQDREKVFERFYRADPSRTGGRAGLGLSIARWIAEQHHGRILAGASTLGGAALLVDLPLRGGARA